MPNDHVLTNSKGSWQIPAKSQKFFKMFNSKNFVLDLATLVHAQLRGPVFDEFPQFSWFSGNIGG